jgi:hypothetical protein
VLGIKPDNYEKYNTIRGREFCHLVKVVSITTGFSFRRDVAAINRLIEARKSSIGSN